MRTMEHGTGSGSPPPAWPPGVGTGEGVMVRRLSVASRDSGAESAVYGEEPVAGDGREDSPPGASARMELGVPPLAAARRPVGSGQSAWLPAPSSAALPSFFHTYASGDQASRSGRTDRAANPDNSRYVGCLAAKRKMVYKGHSCIYPAGGEPMTWFASSMTARRGRRLPLRRTDVHGREG
jgi:hypothetical protein